MSGGSRARFALTNLDTGNIIEEFTVTADGHVDATPDTAEIVARAVRERQWEPRQIVAGLRCDNCSNGYHAIFPRDSTS